MKLKPNNNTKWILEDGVIWVCNNCGILAPYIDIFNESDELISPMFIKGQWASPFCPNCGKLMNNYDKLTTEMYSCNE